MEQSGGTRVLVVDDERDIVDTYASQLGETFDVETAYSGEAALSALTPAIDVVLLDRRMPDISGQEVLTAIRERGLDARVAMVTAEDPDFDIIEMPFDDYVQKPATKVELVNTVRQLKRFVNYEERVQEYYALTAKHAALVETKSQAELDASERFQSLQRDIERAQADLAELMADFDATDFDRAFLDIERTLPSAD
jgi:DNA-binding response OmpR family regulator